MRFLHLSDLHFGKSIYGLSLTDSGDQPHWVRAFLELTDSVKPEAVVIAGDVYDRSAPSAEAVQLLSRMLTGLIDRGIPVMMTAGNHDSARRLAFVRELLERQGLHISPSLTAPGKLTHVTLQDANGPVTFWLMPYVSPALVGEALGAEDLRSYDDAVRRLLAAQEIDFSQRNVIVAHQNVTDNGVEGPRGGSESMVGGVGQVDYTAFDGFDYAALGHIHASYAVGRPQVRYAGSPLCYHFNETKQAPKGPILVELGEKGGPMRIQTLPIPPLHPMVALEGAYEALRDQELAGKRTGEYLSITLTDRRVTPEISEFFHNLYQDRDSRLLELSSSFRLSAGAAGTLRSRQVREKSLPELFSDFCTAQMGGTEPTPLQTELVERAAALMAGEDLQREPAAEAVDTLLRSVGKEAGA